MPFPGKSVRGRSKPACHDDRQASISLPHTLISPACNRRLCHAHPRHTHGRSTGSSRGPLARLASQCLPGASGAAPYFVLEVPEQRQRRSPWRLRWPKRLGRLAKKTAAKSEPVKFKRWSVFRSVFDNIIYRILSSPQT